MSELNISVSAWRCWDRDNPRPDEWLSLWLCWDETNIVWLENCQMKVFLSDWIVNCRISIINSELRLHWKYKSVTFLIIARPASWQCFPGHSLQGLRFVVETLRELLRTGRPVADGLQYPGPGGVGGAGGEPAVTTSWLAGNNNFR